MKKKCLDQDMEQRTHSCLARKKARGYRFSTKKAGHARADSPGNLSASGGKVKKNGLAVFDLDGTTGTQRQGVPRANQDMLRSAGERGIVRVAATGRSLYSFFHSPFAGLAFDHIVFSTGLGVFDTAAEEISVSACLNREQIARVSALLLELGLHFSLHRPVPDNHSFFVCCPDSSNPDMNTRLANNKGLFSPWPGVLPREASQFLIVLPPEKNFYGLRLRQAFEDDFSVIRATSPLDGQSTWMEIFPAGTCKSAAVSKLAEKYGLDRNDVLAVGNDYNDLDLLRWAGKSAVVADSPPALLREFVSVAPCQAGGCAEAVSLWLTDGGNRLARR